MRIYIVPTVIVIALGTLVFNVFLASNDAVMPRLNDGITVSASFYPLAFLAQEIAGETFIVNNITPSDIEPHNYEPTAADIARLVDSRLFIYTSANFESWGERLAGLIEAGGGTSVTVVNPATALPTTQTLRGASYLDSEDKKKPNDEIDPHVWISPKRAIGITQTITDALVNLDPENAQTYTGNSERAIATLADIDNNYNRVLSTCAKKELVTSHDAFGYLAHDYNLKVYPIAGISPDAEPSPQDLAEITKLVKEKNVTHIFMEELGTPKLVETISRETGAQILELSPIESSQDGRTLYAQMNQNLENIKVALQCN